MPRWIASLGPKKIIVGLYQGISTMKISKTDKYLSIMVSSARRPSRIIERQRIQAPSIQAMPSLMEFLEKREIQKYPSSPTRIKTVSI